MRIVDVFTEGGRTAVVLDTLEELALGTKFYQYGRDWVITEKKRVSLGDAGGASRPAFAYAVSTTVAGHILPMVGNIEVYRK